MNIVYFDILFQIEKQCHKFSLNSVGTINRAQLIDDAMSLSRAGYLSYQTSLELTKYLYHETDYLPWIATTNAFDYIQQMLTKTAIYEKLKVN